MSTRPIPGSSIIFGTSLFPTGHGRVNYQLTGIRRAVNVDPPHELEVPETVEARQSRFSVGPALFELRPPAGTDRESIRRDVTITREGPLTGGLLILPRGRDDRGGGRYRRRGLLVGGRGSESRGGGKAR